MYGLPLDFDHLIFVGRTLQQISFSANTIGFEFDGDLSITLLSSFAHKRGDELLEKGDVPVIEAKLMQLAEKVVTSCEVVDNGRTLVLHFENGRSLYCYDDSDQYESFTITYGGREVFV